MTRRQWMKAYSEALQRRGLWFRKEANRAAEIAVQDFYHYQPERVAMVAEPPGIAGKVCQCGFPWGVDPERHAQFCDNRVIAV